MAMKTDKRTAFLPRVVMALEVEELRVLRAALRFAQVSPDKPLSYTQDLSAGRLVERFSVHIDKDIELARPTIGPS